MKSTFTKFKALDPVIEMSRRLNFNISSCASWEDFMNKFRIANDRDVGQMVSRARAVAPALSTGELPVLLALLTAADFAWLADELTGDFIWWRLERTYADHAMAVALVILR